MTNMRSILLAALMAAIPLMTFAETDYVAKDELDAIREGRNNDYQIKTLRVSGNGTIGGNLNLTGTLPGDDVKYAVVGAQSVTNGQAVTLAWGKINMITPINGVTDTTNTITLANTASADVGKMTWIGITSTASNYLGIAKTGNFYGTALVLAPGTSANLFAGTTNTIYGK